MVYLLNTPILTEYGTYRFRKIEVGEASVLIADGFTSAVGHEGTAKVLSAILGSAIPVNRIAIKMAREDKAVVFRVLTRLEEGKILTEDELKAIPYELSLLERVE